MRTRRAVLIGGATTAGALVVGYALWPSHLLEDADTLDAKPGERFLSNWIKLADDDTVTIVIPHCDMGTGIYTALSQMAADEMDADWSKVRAEAAPAEKEFANGPLIEAFALNGTEVPSFLKGMAASTFRMLAANVSIPGAGYVPQITGGSSAVRGTGVFGMRVAGAAVREMLIKAAAARLSANPAEFHTEASRVIHKSGESFRYGELAREAAAYTPSGNPPLKERSQFKLIGQPLQRFDIPDKVDGVNKYGIDTRLPDMWYGAIRVAPVFGGKLVSVSDAPVSRNRGIKKVVKLDDAVVVLADRFWRARAAADSLQPIFDTGGNGNVTSDSLRARHLAALKSGDIKSDMTVGDGADALKNGKLIERLYNVPYLAHAPMEPVNATALYKNDGTLEVWAGTQDGLGARAFCAEAAGLPMEKVTFHLRPSGGAFGRRLPGQWNFLTYAVKAALQCQGTPVKLIFTREQDMQHDFYRPNVTSRFKAAVDADGMPIAWVNDYTTDDTANPQAHIVYGVPHQAYGAVKVATHIPTGPWRSVEASWHGFFIESFVDELAHAAGKDPLSYRQALLKDKPRHLGTLTMAADKAAWGTQMPPNMARGIALVECFDTIVAHVVEAEVADDGTVKVHRVVSAADCGYAVNPDGFKAQIEGAIVFALSAALHGQITIDQGAVVQQNFPDYDMVRLAEAPDIEVYVHESDARLGGAGEPGTPPLAPALTNAIFAATGIRIRDLPVDNVRLGKAARQQASL